MRTLIGQANHIFTEDRDISAIAVNVVEIDGREGKENLLTIASDMNENSMIINSIEQWEQLDILVRKAFDNHF